MCSIDGEEDIDNNNLWYGDIVLFSLSTQFVNTESVSSLLVHSPDSELPVSAGH